jgi:hypothetical protein
MKPLTIITGILSAILITAQAVMGLLIRRGGGGPGLAASHFHTGMLTAVVILLYVALSLALILARPRQSTP